MYEGGGGVANSEGGGGYIYSIYVCVYIRAQVSNTRPILCGPWWLERQEKYPILLFWRFQIKWIHVIISEKCSYGRYFYTQMNNNQMQRELFNNMFGCSL